MPTTRKFKFPSRKKPLRVVVSRKRWVNGDSKRRGPSALRNHQGYMCCLGFACRTMGFKPKDILDLNGPRDLCIDKNVKQIPGLAKISRNTKTCIKLMLVNDDKAFLESTWLSRQEKKQARERRITSLGKRAGIKFVFKP